MRLIHERVLVGMLKRGVAGKDAIAKSCEDDWMSGGRSKKKSSIPRAWKEPVSLSREIQARSRHRYQLIQELLRGG